MRAPLSWLRDFAPFPDDVGELRAALDDLGWWSRAIEQVGEGLGDVVVGRVLEIGPIEGADKIRLVVVDAGGASRSRSSAAPTTSRWATWSRWLRSAPSCPGGFEIGQRKMRGVVSNGMLCSGKELGLSDDGAGLLILGDEAPGDPGTPLTEALGLEPDVVFDITVEGNRPDAWSHRRDRPRPGGPARSARSPSPEPPDPPAAAGRAGRVGRHARGRVDPICAPASR